MTSLPQRLQIELEIDWLLRRLEDLSVQLERLTAAEFDAQRRRTDAPTLDDAPAY
jgi:hypothetical protein